VDNIQAARRPGAAGVILFSYDSLADPRSLAPDYLAQVVRAAFAARLVRARGSKTRPRASAPVLGC
jgi:hypothetical protein